MKARINILKITDSFILLQDLNSIFGSMTITNDAENVVEHFKKLGLLENRKLYYIDTDEQFTELEIVDGKFKSYSYPHITVEELLK